MAMIVVPAVVRATYEIYKAYESGKAEIRGQAVEASNPNYAFLGVKGLLRSGLETIVVGTAIARGGY